MQERGRRRLRAGVVFIPAGGADRILVEVEGVDRDPWWRTGSTRLFRDGLIRAPTVRYTLLEK
jgi:hypothetical protein